MLMQRWKAWLSTRSQRQGRMKRERPPGGWVDSISKCKVRTGQILDGVGQMHLDRSTRQASFTIDRR